MSVTSGCEEGGVEMAAPPLWLLSALPVPSHKPVNLSEVEQQWPRLQENMPKNDCYLTQVFIVVLIRSVVKVQPNVPWGRRVLETLKRVVCFHTFVICFVLARL